MSTSGNYEQKFGKLCHYFLTKVGKMSVLLIFSLEKCKKVFKSALD